MRMDEPTLWVDSCVNENAIKFISNHVFAHTNKVMFTLCFTLPHNSIWVDVYDVGAQHIIKAKSFFCQ